VFYRVELLAPRPTLLLFQPGLGQALAELVNSLTNNKAPGVDEISAEMLKHSKETVAEQLVEFFIMIWQGVEVPADWKKGVIIKLPKKCKSQGLYRKTSNIIRNFLP